MSTPTDRDGNALVPGALYVTMSTHYNGPDRDGVFLYWTGGQLVTEDGDDLSDADMDYDYLVRQQVDINEDMIERD